jgi:hypothetical protein
MSTCTALGPTPPAPSAYGFWIASKDPFSLSIRIKYGARPNLSYERESRVAPFAVKHNFMISTFYYYSYALNWINVWMMAGLLLRLLRIHSVSEVVRSAHNIG